MSNILKSLYTKLISPFHTDLAIDLDERNIKIYQKGKGVVLSDEFSCVIVKGTKQILVFGKKRKKCIGITPGKALLIYPLRDGVICDFDLFEQVLKYFLQKTGIKYPIGSLSIFTTPCTHIQAEWHTIQNVFKGFKTLYIPRPLAALIGWVSNERSKKTVMSVYIGFGCTEIEICNLSQRKSGECNVFRPSVQKMEEALIEYLRKKYDLLIGDSTASRIIEMFVLSKSAIKKQEVRGRYLKTEEPKEITLTNRDVEAAIEDQLSRIVDTIEIYLDDLNSKMKSEIKKNGIVLSGIGAKIKNLDKRLSKSLKCPVNVIDDPENATVVGSGVILENLKEWKDMFMKGSNKKC